MARQRTQITINTDPEKRRPTGEFSEIFKGKAGWRWRSWKSGRIVANSGEDYGKDRGKAIRAAHNFSSYFRMFVQVGSKFYAASVRNV
jgi:hypothetical protein